MRRQSSPLVNNAASSQIVLKEFANSFKTSMLLTLH